MTRKSLPDLRIQTQAMVKGTHHRKNRDSNMIQLTTNNRIIDSSDSNSMAISSNSSNANNTNKRPRDSAHSTSCRHRNPNNPPPTHRLRPGRIILRYRMVSSSTSARTTSTHKTTVQPLPTRAQPTLRNPATPTTPAATSHRNQNDPKRTRRTERKGRGRRRKRKKRRRRRTSARRTSSCLEWSQSPSSRRCSRRNPTWSVRRSSRIVVRHGKEAGRRASTERGASAECRHGHFNRSVSGPVCGLVHPVLHENVPPYCSTLMLGSTWIVRTRRDGSAAQHNATSLPAVVRVLCDAQLFNFECCGVSSNDVRDE
mmetsp:Transcript_6202/g.16866  ORF Transcript_6202/g.16866 Transcript_6202/m.16866 type:complete len:313 (-) Transcript_6202:23-961(-)